MRGQGATSTRANVEEAYYVASQWQLMWRKFKRHKLAFVGMSVLSLLYLFGIFCEFFAPYDPYQRNADFTFAPPQRIRFVSDEGVHLRPFVYGWQRERDPVTLRPVYTVDRGARYPIRFLVRGDAYKFWNLVRGDLHLFGVRDGEAAFLFGTDKLGRDLFSRNLYAARVSLSVGLVGVAISFVLGCILGGISGYYGGAIDTAIQRVVEILISIPTIPLWMALAAALPVTWSPIEVYFGVTIVLSVIGWTGLARVVRGKLLELREADFVMAAQISGATESRVIGLHLLPSFSSYLIVSLTLAVPYMMLGETALSFLGLGIRAPAVSWGALLKEGQNIRTVAQSPWLLIPGLFVILSVLGFNFVGDGLRDAADPYKE